jgi:excisionase family DNA binding protein
MASIGKPQRKFCTTREAADLLGVSLKTAQLWSESGLLEAWRTNGGHRRIDRASVDRLLANGGNPRAQPARPEPSERFQVVVAEDEDSLRRLYAIRLGNWRLAPQVILVSNGFEALLEVGRRRPDLLITDLRMPEMDGFRMLQTLRQVPDLDAMGIVVVTGLEPGEIAQRGGMPEGVHLLPKPIPFDELERIAESLAAERVRGRRAAWA